MIFDWIMAIAIFALLGSIVFGVLLQVLVGFSALLYQPQPSKLSVRQHYYDFDSDN